MKKLILLLAIVAFACNISNATQWSISNLALNPGQFNSVPNALASPSVLNGDTFLIHPTGISYGTFTLTKSITMIGGGFNTQKPGTNYSNLDRIIISSPSAASGSKFYGLRIFNGIIASGSPGILNNLIIEDCYLENNINIAFNIFPVNMVIRNCIISTSQYSIIFGQGGVGQVASSILVSNCLFNTGFYANRAALVVKNCTFLQSSFLDIQFATFENCIIRTLAVTDISNSTFNNCISGVSTLPTAGNSGANNLAPGAVTFVNVPSNTINLTYNYNLTPASLGYTGGNDGQQLGMHGGSSTFSMTGEPLNSAITRSFNITNSVVPVNGTLNINATVTKPNNQ